MSNLKMAVLPDDSKRCYSKECVKEELKECFEKGGTKAVIEVKTVGVKVSCE